MECGIKLYIFEIKLKVLEKVYRFLNIYDIC